MITELMEFFKDLCLLAQFGELHFAWHFLDNAMLQSVDPGQDEHRPLLSAAETRGIENSIAQLHL